MKIAYLILVHNNPAHLGKMLRSLSSENSAFFIHVDKKSDIKDFESITGKNVFFSDRRLPVYWGEYSIVEATLILLHQAVNSTHDYDYYVLLSGSDYPLRSSKYIHDFFYKNRGAEFISMINAQNESGVNFSSPCSRYQARKYCSYLNTLRIPSDKPVPRYAVKILARLRLAGRDYKKYLGALEPYAGSMWWALTKDACRHVLEFVRSNRTFCKYYENTFVPDEMFFHTILGNSMFRQSVKRGLMYVDWSMPEGHSAAGPGKYNLLERSSNLSGHPVPINDSHIDLFEKNSTVTIEDIFGSGEMLFARKFSDDSSNLVRRIEKMIAVKEKKLFHEI